MLVLAAGDGWAAEGSQFYKWAQYDRPPVPIGGQTIQSDANGSVINPMMYEEETRAPYEFSGRVIVCHVPFLGRLFFTKHVQGVVCSSVVLLYWLYGSWSLFTLVLLPHYHEEHITILPLLCKCNVNCVSVRVGCLSKQVYSEN